MSEPDPNQQSPPSNVEEGGQAETPPAQTPEGGTPPAETPPATPSETPTPTTEEEAGEPEADDKKKKKKRDKLTLENVKIGFMGAGKMAEALVNGFMKHTKINAERLFVCAPSDKNLNRFKSLGIKTDKRSLKLFSKFGCDVVFLCFHGNVIKNCEGENGRYYPLCVNYIPTVSYKRFILSLVSGIKIADIKKCLLDPSREGKHQVDLHRIMMNAACAYGLGICAVDKEPDTSGLNPFIRSLLSSVAKLEYIPEDQMDATCAIAGNGLAFAFCFINALADGAFKVGLARDQALRFAAKAAQCGSQVLLESGKHPDELRDYVCTPSGAAIFGVHTLDKADVASGIMAAVEAAHTRAMQLLEKPK